MLERTTASYFEDVITDFKYLQSNVDVEKKILKGRNEKILKNDDFFLEEHIMTRKTRTRRPRISALQSGYCAVCNVPYNSVEDHIQSKKHQKLIGEDANYIALNGSLNGYLQSNTIPFLNLSGIDAIGVHDSSLEEYSPIHKKRNMRKTRAASVMFDRVNPSPLSPTGSDITGHHLRSRRNINYMTPPLEDDSLQEKPDLTVSEDHSEVEQKEKDIREMRATTRSLTKLMFPLPDQEEVWNSGRPKRACISKKRLSVDERLSSNCKTYYKVEVLTSKPRSFFMKNPENSTKRQQSQSPKREEDKDKGLIVKFKKLRNSELVQLNNEATNFLFPKKDDTSEEEEEEGEGEDDEVNTTASNVDSCSNVDIEDCPDSASKVKNEDEGSMDSTGKKKKRRTHAEAFIMDNQKYYKFETPGSSYCRLRYQGSYLPLVVKTPETPNKIAEDDIKTEEPEEKKIKYSQNSKIKLDNYKFAFEKVPTNTGWYNAFKRLDNAEQSYAVVSNYLWEAFLLPYQMRSIPPLDRKVCHQHYDELLKGLVTAHSQASTTNSRGSSPEPPSISSSSSLYDPDEDSKLSASTCSSTCSADEKTKATTSKARKSSRGVAVTSGKNPRKSPRQHASTLAILSDLIQQRKRRCNNKSTEEPAQSLCTIQEEEPPPTPPPPPPPLVEEAPPKPPTPVQYNHRLQTPKQPISTVKKTTVRKVKPKIDYFSMAKQIEEQFDEVLNDDIVDCELELCEDAVDFNNSRTTLQDIMGLYEENNSKETEKSCRRFFNGTPGRKAGVKKRKLNKTGWPNKSKKPIKKELNKEKGENDTASTVGSVSVNNSDEEEEEEEEIEAPVKEVKGAKTISDKRRRDATPKSGSSDQNCDAGKNRVKVLSNKLVNSDLPQPYVCVQKLDSKKLVKHYVAKPKRTMIKRPRRMPGSPKSPRMLRKPRGKWYRER